MNHLAALRIGENAEWLPAATRMQLDVWRWRVRNILLAERRNKIARLLGGQGMVFQHPGRCSTYLDLLMIHSGAWIDKIMAVVERDTLIMVCEGANSVAVEWLNTATSIRSSARRTQGDASDDSRNGEVAVPLCIRLASPPRVAWVRRDGHLTE